MADAILTSFWITPAVAILCLCQGIMIMDDAWMMFALFKSGMARMLSV